MHSSECQTEVKLQTLQIERFYLHVNGCLFRMCFREKPVYTNSITPSHKHEGATACTCRYVQSSKMPHAAYAETTHRTQECISVMYTQ